MPLRAADLIELLESATIEEVTKPWGHELVVNAGSFILKLIRVEEGHRTSLQKHVVKDEIIFVMRGAGGVVRPNADGESTTTQGSSIRIRPGTVHRTVGPVTLVEITSPENDDVVRLDDDYRRAT